MLNVKKFFTKILVYMVEYGLKNGTIKSGDNLNNYRGVEKSGFYEIQSGVSNAPVAWSWLIVVGGAGTLQIVFVQNRMYVRAYTGSPLAWTTWRNVGLS